MIVMQWPAAGCKTIMSQPKYPHSWQVDLVAIQYGWATCAITQNGALRIMSQPKYPHSWQVDLVAETLAEMTDTENHVQFWPDASLLTPGVIDWQQVSGPKQITDLYLLALAAKNGGRFVTFDGERARRPYRPSLSGKSPCCRTSGG